MIEARSLTKTYMFAGERVDAIDGVDFPIEEGDFIVVCGASGSGKGPT